MSPLQYYRSLNTDARRYWWTVGTGVLLLIGLVLWLRAVEHPWEGKTARRVARGDRLGVADYVQIYAYWAGVRVAVIISLLLASSRWWWRWARGETPRDSPGGVRIGRVSLIGILVVLVIATFLRAPTMDRLVLRDEQDNLRRSIHGYHEIDRRSAEPAFRENTWQDAFFENRYANNPILFSLAAKTSLATWRKVTGAPREKFHPVALRMPSLLGGLASIVGTWWLLLLLRLPLPAFLATLYLALHPLHIEYSVEARGYGIMMSGVVLAAIFAVYSLRRGRWRDWAGFAAGLFVTLYAYAGSIYFVAAIGTCVGIVLLARTLSQSRPDARAQLFRLALVGLVAGTVYYMLIAPSLPQIQAHLTNNYEKMPLSPSWLFHAATEYGGGSLFSEGWSETAPHSLAAVGEFLRTQMIPKEAPFLLLVLVLTPLLALLGIARLARCGPAGRAVIAAPLLGVVIDYSHHQFITHLYAYYWYWIYTLPFLAAAVGVGLAEPERWLRARRGSSGNAKPVLTMTLAGAFFALFLWQTAPGKPGRMSRPRGPLATYITHCRGSSNWVVYASGKMLRQPVDEEIAETFPW